MKLSVEYHTPSHRNDHYMPSFPASIDIMVYSSIIQFRSRRTFARKHDAKKANSRARTKNHPIFPQIHFANVARICVRREEGRKKNWNRKNRKLSKINFLNTHTVSSEQKKKIILQQSVIRSFAIGTFWMKGWIALSPLPSSFFRPIPSFNFHKIFRFRVIYSFFLPHYPPPPEQPSITSSFFLFRSNIFISVFVIKIRLVAAAENAIHFLHIYVFFPHHLVLLLLFMNRVFLHQRHSSVD